MGAGARRTYRTSQRRVRREQHEDSAVTRPRQIVHDLCHCGIMTRLVLTWIGNVVGQSEQAVLFVRERRREDLLYRDGRSFTGQADPRREEREFAAGRERGAGECDRRQPIEQQLAQHRRQVERDGGELQRLSLRPASLHPAHLRRPAGGRTQRRVESIDHRFEAANHAATLTQQL